MTDSEGVRSVRLLGASEIARALVIEAGADQAAID